MHQGKVAAGLAGLAIIAAALTGCGTVAAGRSSTEHMKPFAGTVVRVSGKHAGAVLTQGYKVPIY